MYNFYSLTKSLLNGMGGVGSVGSWVAWVRWFVGGVGSVGPYNFGVISVGGMG